MKCAFVVLLFLIAFGAHIEAKTVKKSPRVDASGNAARQCAPPKRWVEVDALADDAGRPSRVICK